LQSNKMLSELDTYYISQEEPTKSCLLALRHYIINFDPDMTETWTHKMPMFRYKAKLFCYLWIDKKSYAPYIGMYKGIEIDHPKLILGSRNKMKIMHIDPELDLPIKTLDTIMKKARSYIDKSFMPNNSYNSVE